MATAMWLRDVGPSPWQSGLAAAYGGDGVFVTPAVDGWVLAVSQAFGASGADDRVDVASLSKAFGEVQKFVTHRVSEVHEWQRWVDGRAVRRFSYVGDAGTVELDEGVRGDAELDLVTQDAIDSDQWDDVVIPDEELVMAVAGEWSVDPTTLGDRADVSAEGLLGVSSAR